MSNFDSDFNLFNKVFKFMFAFVFIAIIVYWIAIAVFGVALLNNPEGVGEFVGEVKKGFDSVK